MSVPKVESKALSSGKAIPVVGLGTWKAEPGKVGQAVKDAIECGYRHIDCALVYGNEAEIGNAFKEVFESKKVKREDLYIVSKLWLTYTRPDRVIKGIQKTLTDLKLNYLDLYLVHFPHSFAQQDEELIPKDSNGNIKGAEVDICETWKAMEDLVTKGLTKSIGISNFNSKQVERILKCAQIKPVINQIEVHPYLAQKKLIEFCNQRGIAVTAYSPLGGEKNQKSKEKSSKNLLVDPLVKKLAEKYKKNVGQILLRFAIDRSLIVLAKSIQKERIASNLHLFDFKLSPEDIKQLEGLDCNYRTCDQKSIGNVSKLKEFPFVGVEF